MSPRRVGSTIPLGLLGGPVGHDGRQGPGGHGQVGPAQAGLGADLVDDQLLDGPGVPAERRRPVRGQQTLVGQGPALLGRVGERGDGGHDRRQLLPEPLGLGRQLDGQAPAPALQGQPGRLGPERGGAPDELAQGGGPAQVDVGVVLPGEAHAPEDLDGALGRLDVAVEGQRGGQLDGQSALRSRPRRSDGS